MPKYTCDGFKSIQAAGPDEAARTFAERWARKDFGKNGAVHHVRLDCWTRNGLVHTYQAFIGKWSGGRSSREMNGRNVWLSVTKVEQ